MSHEPCLQGAGPWRSESCLFEDLVLMSVEMDLVDMVVDEGVIKEETFVTLTDPRSAGTGLRYARLLRRYMDAYLKKHDRARDGPPIFGVEAFQSYLVSLVQEEVGFRTPQSLIYAVEHFSSCFGFNSPCTKNPRVRKLAFNYVDKAPDRNPAPYFEVSFLEYLERVVLDNARDMPSRVACGKLRLCTQASIRRSDLACTSMSDVEWCRMVGGSEVLGLRAKAAKTKSGPRPWAASLLGVNPENDGWLTRWVDLLINTHGPSWKEHSFVGCASDGSGGWLSSPPLITEDTLTVKRGRKNSAIVREVHCVGTPASQPCQAT